MNPSLQAMKEANNCTLPQSEATFNIEDLDIFDDETLQVILRNCRFGLTVEKLARSLHGVNEGLIQRIERNLLSSQRSDFLHELHRTMPEALVGADRRYVLHGLFWELTYWKTPDLYEELIEGEKLHPGIFQQLEPEICNKVVLDAGAGGGRATFECVKYGARKVYAVEPSPGLLRIKRRKIACQAESRCVKPLQGRFDRLPLEDDSIDTALSCSAFTSDPVQGGEPGLAELRRVIKPDGKLIIIWPLAQDDVWFNQHSFCYDELPLHEEMLIRFRTPGSTLRCVQRFCANNADIVDFVVRERKLEIPYSMLGLNPPCDCYWLSIQKCKYID